jgi:hypothetical protein
VITYATHGHSGRIEHPDRIEGTWRAGFYLEIRGRGGQQTWVHYAIPTPQPSSGDLYRPQAIVVRCRMPERDATLAAAHIYDGEHKIDAHDRVHHRPGEWTDVRFDVSGEHPVQHGVGVSLNLQWGHAEPGHEGRFRTQISAVRCIFTR